MKIYRIKHVPSGMYYTPSREVLISRDGVSHYVKSNLSKKGKVYIHRKPQLPTCYYDHLLAKGRWAGKPKDNYPTTAYVDDGVGFILEEFDAGSDLHTGE